jgi:hypothetical protein
MVGGGGCGVKIKQNLIHYSTIYINVIVINIKEKKSWGDLPPSPPHRLNFTAKFIIIL